MYKAMATSNLFRNFPSFCPPTKNPTKNLFFFHASLPFTCNDHLSPQRRCFSVHGMASSSIIPVIDTEYLEREFSGCGVSFTSIGDSCVVRMGLDNGSVASLMLPSGLITSYKPHMWHGSTLELLHTTVSEGDDGGAVVQGGASVDLRFGSQDESWSPKTWILRDVRGTSSDFIQVELISSDSEAMVQVKYIVTLQPDHLISEVVISNLKSSPIELTGTLMSHLAVSTPDATYVVGLQGSNYWTKPPFFTNFSIIPPALLQSQSQGKRNQKSVESETMEIEGEEKDNNLQLTEQMSRIYTSTPRMFEIIDRGRRNSVGLGRGGFEEMYLLSPGSNYESFGKFAYICTGPSAMLKPITLNPQGVWSGLQYLHNPNL